MLLKKDSLPRTIGLESVVKQYNMKIEMAESLLYSWLRHIKGCQIVQTNWKTSPQWPLQYQENLSRLMKLTEAHFTHKYAYQIYKKTSSCSQLLRQGECDALGTSFRDGQAHIFALDVAFHESGLNYGTRQETVMKVISKSLRTAMCLYGYLGIKTAEILFASPKIYPAIWNDLVPCIEDINILLAAEGYSFTVRVVANEEFNNTILQPVLQLSNQVADTSELFLRSYQLCRMFPNGGVFKHNQGV